MEFDRRTRYASTGAERASEAPVPGKRTLTQEMVPLEPGIAPSPDHGRVTPATPEAPPPTGARPTLQALFGPRHPAPDPEQVGVVQRRSSPSAGAPSGAGAAGGSRSTATATDRSGSGSPLPEDVRDRMGRSFGADFSSVRVHQGGEAEAIGAVAYARGSDLHFASGQYDPRGAAGQHLLAHELAHVVQQGEGRVAPTVQAKGLGINDDPGLEREADQSADRVARGELARPDRGGHGVPHVAPPAHTDAPVQGFFRTNDFKVDHRDTQQAPFTTQSPRPEASAREGSEGIDVTRRVGPVVPTDVALRVADDLTMAVHDTEAEPKEFYATHHVVAAANAKLTETESSFRLEDQGSNSIAVGPNQLSMVKPVNQRFPANESEGGKAAFASLIRHLCIEMTGEVVGGRGQMSGFEAVFRDRDRGTSFTEQINPSPQQDSKVDRLGAHLAKAGDDATPEDAHRAMNGKDALPRDYARELGQRQGRHELDPQNRQLGINEHALPDVGEGYAIFSQSSPSRPNGDYAARPDGGAVHRDNFWGYHFAGVVARSVQGDDRVCLENYNRAPELKDTAGAVLLELPKYREQVRLHREKYPDDSVDDVIREILGSNPDAVELWTQALATEQAEQLWFFRMYGTKEGQSFHEQQHEDGGVVNPITLHVRRSVQVQKQDKTALVDHNVHRFAEALDAVALPEGPAREELRKLVAALQQEGAACRGLIDGAVDNPALMQAVRDVKARFTKFIEGDLVAGLRRVYGLIVSDPEAGDGLDRKGLIGAIHGSLQRSFFELLSDFFFEMHQGLPPDEQDRRDSLDGLRAILDALPATAFDEVSPEARTPGTKGTAFGQARFSNRFGGHDEEDSSLGSSQLGMFLALNHLRLEATVTDGNCLYDALRLQLRQVQDLTVTTGALRTSVAALIDANRDRFAPFLANGVDNAIRRIMTTRSWDNEGGDVAAQVIATVLQRDVIVLSPRGIDVRRPDDSLARPGPALIQSDGRPLTIAYNGHSHYYSTSPL